MSKFKLSLYVILVSIINTSVFASVCLKNDMNGMNNVDSPIVISNDGGKTWSRKIRVSNIYVSENFVPKLSIKNDWNWRTAYDKYTGRPYWVYGPDFVADNFGNDLEDGDMLHIGGNVVPYISWVEKGNCNGRAPT